MAAPMIRGEQTIWTLNLIILFVTRLYPKEHLESHWDRSQMELIESKPTNSIPGRHLIKSIFRSTLILKNKVSHSINCLVRRRQEINLYFLGKTLHSKKWEEVARVYVFFLETDFKSVSSRQARINEPRRITSSLELRRRIFECDQKFYSITFQILLWNSLSMLVTNYQALHPFRTIPPPLHFYLYSCPIHNKIQDY